MNADIGIVLLFFSGVIAFVPEFPEPNQVNAFLINVAKHDQRLRIPLGSLKGGKCPYTSYLSGYCEKDEANTFCDCDLDKDKGVAVSIVGEYKSTKSLPTKPPVELLDKNVGDISWLVNMWNVKASVASLKTEKIQKYVKGQVSFNWVDAATCRFEEALCEVDKVKMRRIYAVKFDVAFVDNLMQATPELVVFESTNTSQEVTIKLEQRGKPVADLILICPDRDSCPVLITNVMELPDNSEELCEDCGESKKEGEHFLEYRQLTGDPFGVSPHRLCKAKHYRNVRDELPALCEVLNHLPPRAVPTAVSNRVICPPAILAPD